MVGWIVVGLVGRGWFLVVWDEFCIFAEKSVSGQLVGRLDG